jgi:uncharacterized integral membrane protein
LRVERDFSAASVVGEAAARDKANRRAHPRSLLIPIPIPLSESKAGAVRRHGRPRIEIGGVAEGRVRQELTGVLVTSFLRPIYRGKLRAIMKTNRFRLWALTGLALLIGVFILQNTRVVEFRFLLWKLEMSRSILLFGILSAGFVLGWITARLRRA